MRDLVTKTPNVTQFNLQAFVPVIKARETLNDQLLGAEKTHYLRGRVGLNDWKVIKFVVGRRVRPQDLGEVLLR